MTAIEPVAATTVGFGGIGAKLNWLRAGVLGANDGIVSGSGLLVGVAAASHDNAVILTAGVAGLLAGALSMAMGEYVSVSSQRDTERALILKEQYDLEHTPDVEFEELVEVYRGQGLTDATARQVVSELTSHDPLGAHLRAEYGVHQEELTNPWHAAFASALAFLAGWILPLAAMLLSPAATRIEVTVVTALVTLAMTGWISGTFSGTPRRVPVLRNMLGGGVAMALTWGIGRLFGVALG